MQRLVLALYQLAGMVLLPLIIIALLVRSRKQPEYRARLLERLGFCSKAKGKGGIIIHGASLGEITSLKPFITQVLEQFPNIPVTVTSFTPAGSKQVEHLFGQRVNHTYLPFDIPVCNWIFLNRLKPSVIVFMETELWPSLTFQAKKSNAKLMLINARLSNKSVTQYQKVSRLIKLTLNQFDTIQAQSPENAARFISLGAPENHVANKGNLKFDIAKPENINSEANRLKKISGNRPVWTVGSSHTDEEDLLIDVFLALKKHVPTLLLVLAPRHSERYKAIEGKLQTHNLTYNCRSNKASLSAAADVWLIDTIGELLLFYAVADICTVAGSFDDTGGHNTLEPALFGKVITVGPHTHGTQELNNALLEANALLQHSSLSTKDITNELLSLFSSKQKQEELGNNAEAFLAKNRGATQSAITALEKLTASDTK